MPSEFDLIRRYFTHEVAHTELGVGDDAALLAPRPGMRLAVSTDMLVAGTHFFADTDPCDLGWKTLAVNVSDLAAMGAEPRWAVLALSLPRADEAWVADFARGFLECACRFGIDLIGGDTTRGPLNLAVTIFGEVPEGQAITRAGAHPEDDLWVSGQPGRAALGLAVLRNQVTLSPEGRSACLSALHRPQPRVELGLGLRGVASAMLDVSDGLLGDLAHLLERSGVGAIIDAAALPIGPLVACGADIDAARAALLCGGDDYELIFAAPATARAHLAATAGSLGLALTRIGVLTDQAGRMFIRDHAGRLSAQDPRGYDHFRQHAP
ncbi:MAG TPA: thiamine-phosphate kinase [Rhodocyclaceae bacterium]|nr:thiamine-phosphate kinase [Rhodocyclaceae bacterium]